jgi:hypothetical protein
MLTQPSLVDAKLNMGRKKKPPTVQVRLSEDVVDLAWKIAPYQGYRAAGDFLSGRRSRPELLGQSRLITTAT